MEYYAGFLFDNFFRLANFIDKTFIKKIVFVIVCENQNLRNSVADDGILDWSRITSRQWLLTQHHFNKYLRHSRLESYADLKFAIVRIAYPNWRPQIFSKMHSKKRKVIIVALQYRQTTVAPERN